MVSLCYTVLSKTHRDPPNSVFWVLGFIDCFFLFVSYSFFHGLQFWQFISQCLLAPRGFPQSDTRSEAPSFLWHLWLLYFVPFWNFLSACISLPSSHTLFFLRWSCFLCSILVDLCCYNRAAGWVIGRKRIYFHSSGGRWRLSCPVLTWQRGRRGTHSFKLFFYNSINPFTASSPQIHLQMLLHQELSFQHKGFGGDRLA